MFEQELCRNVDQADDLVQETIARGCKNIALFEPGTNMVAWLTTILRNHFFSECRRASYRPSDPIEDHADTLTVPATQFISVETRELRVALQELPEPERVALVMVLGAEYQYEEVARAFGCPTGTVKSRVSRARRKILSRLSTVHSRTASISFPTETASLHHGGHHGHSRACAREDAEHIPSAKAIAITNARMVSPSELNP
jgi:RNA polymerase sigma-70 factor (ECF subfamily)